MQNMRNMQNCRQPIPTPYREYSVPGSRPSCRQNNLYSGDFPIAMAYVPWQRWGDTYSAEEALNRGTLFPELYKPLSCMGGMKHERK